MVVVLLLAVGGTRPTSDTTTPITARPRSVEAPDLSGWSPRERADRLFELVMTATQSGDTAQIGFHAPMALAAYRALDSLDAEACYHVGLLLAATGDHDGALHMADVLQAGAPGHLLAATLRFSVARALGDSTAMLNASREFVQNYRRELSTGRPEYITHRRTIDAFLAEALRMAGGVGN